MILCVEPHSDPFGRGLNKKNFLHLCIMTSQSNYNKNLKNFARENRVDGTIGEATLWKLVLKAKQTGYQFNRQFPVGNYIVDFICRNLKLIIEIDGSSHSFSEVSIKDAEKQAFLEKKGYHILRFTENDVVKDLGKVTDIVLYTIEMLGSDLD